MDSALNCLTFALNALGYVVDPAGFQDITTSGSLHQISPMDILGRPGHPSKPAPLSGYARVFPRLQNLWLGEQDLITNIRDFHHVSKHRQSVWTGGQAQRNAPPGFYERAGISADHPLAVVYHPAAETILKHDPRSPRVARQQVAREEHEVLEQLVPRFAGLIDESSARLLADVTSTIPLKEREFLPSSR
jgi:hypothetical protein